MRDILPCAADSFFLVFCSFFTMCLMCSLQLNLLLAQAYYQRFSQKLDQLLAIMWEAVKDVQTDCPRFEKFFGLFTHTSIHNSTECLRFVTLSISRKIHSSDIDQYFPVDLTACKCFLE